MTSEPRDSEWGRTQKNRPEKSAVPPGCNVTDVKVNGGQVVVTSVCAGKENVGTTTYRGDSFESTNSNGTKAQAKWVGACK